VAPVLSICGPSCSGKSSTARALAAEYPTYIEIPEENPYLRALVEDSTTFDAMANQMWFLRRMGDFIKDADSYRPMVLDQDPSAIVFVYARIFRDEFRISDSDYVRLTEELKQVEEKLQQWSSPRKVLVLDAPAEMLHARAVQRLKPGCAPPVEWFVKIRTYFQEFSRSLPKKLVLSTADTDPLEVIAMARRLIRSGDRPA
jgi:deoxyadenosine/deoxycytidine kinase